MSIAGTKRYKSIQEIQSEPGFGAEQPANLTSYRELMGYYSFESEELSCCLLEKSGGLCHQKHKWGWVLQRTDGVVTIIGHTCAESNFGADSTLGRDITRANNEVARLQEDERLNELLSQRDERVIEIDAAVGKLKELLESVASIKQRLGPKASLVLERLASKGTGIVEVEGFTPATYNDKGEKLTNEVRFRIPIAKLGGIGICKRETVVSRIEDLSKLRNSYFSAIEKGRGAASTKARRALAATLSGQQQQLDWTKQLLEAGFHFLTNDFRPLCFMTKDRSDRFHIVRAAFELLGQNIGKDPAKSWVSRFDSDLCSRHGVKMIRVVYT